MLADRDCGRCIRAAQRSFPVGASRQRYRQHCHDRITGSSHIGYIADSRWYMGDSLRRGKRHSLMPAGDQHGIQVKGRSQFVRGTSDRFVSLQEVSQQAMQTKGEYYARASENLKGVEALKAQILHQQPVRCDEPAWLLWGISLAGWNLLASVVMVGCCLVAFLGSRRPWERAGLRRGTA